MTLKETKILLKTLRDVFDITRIVDPETQEVFDFDENKEFKPVSTCYCVWNRNKPCVNCTTLKTCRENITGDKYEKLGNDVYHITSKPIEISGKIYALEIVSKLDDANDASRREAIIHEQERNMEIINILASEYSSVYYIDLLTDELDPYTMNAETESEFGQIFRSGIKYSDAFKLYVNTLVFEEDKKIMLDAGSVKNIMEELKTKKTFITTYRSDNHGDPHYCEMKFVKVGDIADAPVAVALGFSDKNDDIRHEKTIERNQEIIQTLSNEYTSVYHVDFETGDITVSKIHYDTENAFVDDIDHSAGFSEAFKKLLKAQVDNSDYNELEKLSSVEYIRSLLKTQKIYTCTFRVGTETDYKYNEMKIVKVNDDEIATAIVLGIADKDEEIRAKLKAEIESKRNTEIIEILASEYSSVYYIDLTTDELDPYTMNEETETEFGHIFRSGIKYSDAFKLYVDTLVYEDDKTGMLTAGSIKNIATELINKKTFITTYRSDNNGDPHYCEMKFVKVGDAIGKPNEVALGFADKHEEIRAKLEQQAIINRNNEIIEILASEYTSVYYIDLTTDELTPYTMNEETENQFGVLFKNMTYSDAFRMYVDTLIIPEDKQMMLRAGSVGNIMKELRHKKTFITTYRSENNDHPRYCEMKFVKVGTEDGTPQAVALGFADKDDELRNRIEQETSRKRNTDIIEILASEYTSVYYIDLTTDELDPYTMNEETESEFGQIFRSGIKYSEAYKLYVNTLVYEEDKEMMLKAGSIYNILIELNEKKTFITTYRSDINGEMHYCEMKFVKVGDDENPQAVALGFADKDEEIRESMLEQQEKEKNFEIIDILASEYSSVYYIDLNTDGLTPYTMNDQTKEFLGDAFTKNIPYSEAFKVFVNNAVAEESKAEMLNAGTIENIRQKLRTQKTFITTYLNNNNEYSEMKFVKVGSEAAKPQAVALGFSVVDESYRKELANKQRDEFINGLADDYEAVFHVEAETDTIETVRMTNAYKQRNPSLEHRMNYYKYVESVASNIIVEDRQQFIDALSPENIDKEFKKEDAFFHNYRIVKDNTITYYQLKVIHTGDWNVDKNFLIGVHNMDELTRAQVEQEEILEDARIEAESANRAKSTFLFNMSHDIRTPMNAIIGFNNMAIKHIDDKEKLADCLEKVNLSSHHLLSIINDVLDMARIESGKVTIDEDKVYITDAANSLSEIVKQSVKGKELTFTTDFSKITHNYVYADELRVNRVLMNIANNAVKYTNAGGTVSYTIIETDSARDGYASFDFIIEDNGIGMSDDFLKHIFEAFTRESTSTITGIQGTGLGMSITKELVELMKGTIKIDSELGKGTKVTVHFDFRIANDENQNSENNNELNIEKLNGKRVLLVEDNELNREIACEILEELGIIVDQAEDGTIGVEKCINAIKDGTLYDFILMDIQMPIMDGYKATKQIREYKHIFTKTVPIIAMTANAFAEDKKKAFDSGMNAHLAKPIDINELIKTLISFIKE